MDRQIIKTIIKGFIKGFGFFVWVLSFGFITCAGPMCIPTVEKSDQIYFWTTFVIALLITLLGCGITRYYEIKNGE